MSPADSQVEDLKNDLDRHRTRAQDKAQDTYEEGKEKSQNWWNKLFGTHLSFYDCIVNWLLDYTMTFANCMALDYTHT